MNRALPHMKRTRQEFLAAAAAVGVGMVAMQGTAQAQSASPTPAGPAAPKPTPTPSPAARAFAERMRTFDPQLTDEEVTMIAQGADQSFDLGKHFNPKGKRFKNGDGPTPQFEVRG